MVKNPGTARSVTTTTSGQNIQAYGVIVIGGADAADVLVKIWGEVLVKKNNTTVSAMDWVTSSSTAKMVDDVGGAANGCCGIFLEGAAAGVATVRIFLQAIPELK